MSKRIILYSLQTFSTTGGIQKMTRTLAHSLFQIGNEKNWLFRLFSLYDTRYDLMSQYVPVENYKGFSNSRLRLSISAIKGAGRTDVAIFNHINFSIVAIAVKMLNPSCQVWLIAHGIEVWRPLSATKRLLLSRFCDRIICVSHFTKNQMEKRHGSSPEKCIVLNNALDPFIQLPTRFDKPDYLLNRYSINPSDQVIFTLTRLASSEQYKGYEQVIRSVKKLKVKFPHIKYILSGQYDAGEERRIRELVAEAGVEGEVILTGFLNESELTDHFLLADLFVLPSKKEGFGIVFVEALACGLPVICGDADGSIDAIKGGVLGKAINADDAAELETAIEEYLGKPPSLSARLDLQRECLHNFNENEYIKKLKILLDDEQIGR